MKATITSTWEENMGGPTATSLTNVVLTITIDSCELEQLNHVLRAVNEACAMTEFK